MELLQIVHPETGLPTGQTLPRHEAIASQAWCRSTNVFVLNSEGQVLCHQRSLVKERMPGVWSTHLGGHVADDETYESNAGKELGEEAGIDVAAAGLQLIPWRTTKIPSARLWMRDFVTLCDAPAESFTPQPGEVAALAWHSPADIMDFTAANPAGWCAGTHDFVIEYHSMRSVLVAAHSLGVIDVPRSLHMWEPSVTVSAHA